MIQLSNVDAEKVCIHLKNRLADIQGRIKNRVSASTAEINEARMLGLLLKKINKKLDKECPERQNIK